MKRFVGDALMLACGLKFSIYNKEWIKQILKKKQIWKNWKQLFLTNL